MSDMKIGVVGCAGRMGVALLKQISETSGCEIAGGTERPGSVALGQDIGVIAGLGNLDIKITDDAAALIGAVDAILDFTAPAATVKHAALCGEHGTAHIIGTTGMEAEHQGAIDTAALLTPVVQAGNMSVGVNLLVEVTRRVAATLDADWDVEVVEMHHRHKVDAPSGTALMLGRAAADGRGINHDSVVKRGRDGITGERERGEIGYASLRGGNVVGDHTVIFAADNERIEISHKASDRALFARGAVAAALWTKDRAPGHYNMADVLGF
jgi:4-hydroxy-tetrahydrodipicolinate reductase